MLSYFPHLVRCWSGGLHNPLTFRLATAAAPLYFPHRRGTLPHTLTELVVNIEGRLQQVRNKIAFIISLI